MNLTVALHEDRGLMRLNVEGRWRNGDALKLAYMIKAAVSRSRQDHVLIDLRGVTAPAGAEGKFLICDRLQRALGPKLRIGLVGEAGLVDVHAITVPLVHCPHIALFGAEPDALRWLAQ